MITRAAGRTGLILGDSLQVMNSLLVREKESLGRKVQMVYFDPPYGVKFGSNFPTVCQGYELLWMDNDDKSMTREPEMVTAFRDTWKLGMHSYMTYIRDRLILARELLDRFGIHVSSRFRRPTSTASGRSWTRCSGRRISFRRYGIQTTTQTTSSNLLVQDGGLSSCGMQKTRLDIHYNQIYLEKSDRNK